MTVNKKWHRDNPMPKDPTFEQRKQWHFAHRQNCMCRPIPKKLIDQMKKRSISMLEA